MKNKIKSLLVLNIFITLLILTSCTQPQFNNEIIKMPQDIVDYCVENATVFDFDNTSNSIPDEFVHTLSDYKVVLSGEMHYVQEHQEMMGSLLERLHDHGFRYYLQETSSSSGLMIDYYIKGKLSTLEADEKFSDFTMIEKLANFNQRLREEGREEEQISYVGFDLNHMRIEYQTALAHMINLYQLPSDTFTSYNNDALKIKEALDKGKFKELDAEELDELKYITEAQIESTEILANWDDVDREDFIEKYVFKAIDESKEGEKLLVNAGSWHAQLILHWNVTKDDSFQWLGMRLKQRYKDDPNGLYSFFCNTYKGEIRSNLYRPDSFNYEADDKLRPGSLIPYLMEAYGKKTVFVDFKAVPDNSLSIDIQIPRRIIDLPLNRQFNGMLIYPEIHVPKTLKYYED